MQSLWPATGQPGRNFGISCTWSERKADVAGTQQKCVLQGRMIFSKMERDVWMVSVMSRLARQLLASVRGRQGSCLRIGWKSGEITVAWVERSRVETRTQKERMAVAMMPGTGCGVFVSRLPVCLKGAIGLQKKGK